MKKSVATFTLVIMIIICLASIAWFGLRALKIPSVFDDDGIRLGLDLAGGSTIVYEATADYGTPTEDDMNAVTQMLRSRFDMLNYTEATVTRSGYNFRVEIPGISDPESAVQLLGASAVLEFRDADGNVVLEGKDIKKATAMRRDTDTMRNEIFIELELNGEEAIEKFAEATRNAAAKSSTGKNYIGIYLDDALQSQPYVQGEIRSEKAEISNSSSGGFSREYAEWLSGVISSGSMPLKLTNIQLTSVGPLLGEKALETSLIAGGIGTILVMLFMIAIYRLPGFVSSIALCAYVAIVAIALVITQTNLSLPGIAGIILSIGMAVDANVIIFERIKEELRTGKAVKAAVKSGFNRAFTAIIDSNITTLIAAAVLWFFGTGPIKGFASTLFIGVVVSLISAVVITRLLLTRLAEMNLKNKKLYGV